MDSMIQKQLGADGGVSTRQSWMEWSVAYFQLGAKSFAVAGKLSQILTNDLILTCDEFTNFSTYFNELYSSYQGAEQL